MYWDDLMSSIDIATHFDVHDSTIRQAFSNLKIPTRSPSEASRLGLCGGRYISGGHWMTYVNRKRRYEHTLIVEGQLKRTLSKKEKVHHKDFHPLNNHPLNLSVMTIGHHSWVHRRQKMPDRIPLYEIYLRMAEQIAERSTCIRMKQGAVIVSYDLKKVYSLGFNGTVKNWVNSCNGIKGQCGCIHAEENALLKCETEDKNKVLFCTSGPCMNCAKKLIQSGFSDVFYRKDYRDTRPVVFLHYHGIRTCKYDLYKGDL